MIGYGEYVLDVCWFGGVKIVVQIVLNYEEGGENSIEYGDVVFEVFLFEIIGCQLWFGKCYWNMELIYDYGVCVGFWWLYWMLCDIFVIVYGVVIVLECVFEQVVVMQVVNWEIVMYGLKWIDYCDIFVEVEVEYIVKVVELYMCIIGEWFYGFYQGCILMNMVGLGCEEGGFEYLVDMIVDDLFYWYVYKGKLQLMVFYMMDVNDMWFFLGQGFGMGVEFFDYLCDSFDVFYVEGQVGLFKMMFIGLYCCFVGCLGWVMVIQCFLEYCCVYEGVWFVSCLDIVCYWVCEYFYYLCEWFLQMDCDVFVQWFGGVYEYLFFIVEWVWDVEMGVIYDMFGGLVVWMVQVFCSVLDVECLGVLNVYLDLVGKLVVVKQLIVDSSVEQVLVGLDVLIDVEWVEFQCLNVVYVVKYGFFFIIVVCDYDKFGIMVVMFVCFVNDIEIECVEVECQVVCIGVLCLQDMLK